MRFIILHHDDPLSLQLWSGTPFNIVRGLRAEGHEVAAVGNLRGNIEFFSRVKTAIYKYVLGRKYIMNRNPRVIRARAADANRRLREAGHADAILITTLQDAAYLETEIPIVLIHDATWTQLLDYYPGLERSLLCQETIQGGITLDGIALKLCRKAIYSSRWAADRAIEEFDVDPGKVSVASFGANLEPAPTRETVQSGLAMRGKGKLKLLFVGVEWGRKGADVAVRVAEELQQRGTEVELNVVGCNPPGAVPSCVRLHGVLRRDNPEGARKLDELFQTSDFFILPTRADATPVSFAEAAAYGLPIMAAETGGVAQMVRAPWGIRPALDAEPRVYADWALTLFKDRAEYERIAWLAREAYESELNWPAFCRHLVHEVATILYKG